MDVGRRRDLTVIWIGDLVDEELITVGAKFLEKNAAVAGNWLPKVFSETIFFGFVDRCSRFRKQCSEKTFFTAQYDTPILNWTSKPS